MKLACVQTDVVFGDPAANATVAIAHLEALALQGVQLVVFPEAFLTGYCVDSAEEAEQIAIHRNSTALVAIADAVDRLGLVVILGFAEIDGGQLFNTAALFEVGRPVMYYRKTHLPCLGLDRFVMPGDKLPVFDTRVGRVGVLICFDLRPPEATRVLALAGAELLVLPTNWPEGAETSADFVAITRAHENRLCIATCNRIGEEGGFRFIGRSKILSASGQVVASASSEATVLIADIDLNQSGQKKVVHRPGQYEIDVMSSRRPNLYGTILDPVAN